MVNEFEAFMNKASEITERQAESDRNGAELGYVWCTPLEAGVMLDASEPLHVSQARSHIRYTSTPRGVAAWERGAAVTQKKLEQLLGEKPSKAVEPEVQSPFPAINITT